MSYNLANIGSDNGLSPVRRQAFTRTNADVSIGPLETNLIEIWIQIQNFSLMKMHLNMSAEMAAILSRMRWLYINVK